MDVGTESPRLLFGKPSAQMGLCNDFYKVSNQILEEHMTPMFNDPN